MPYAVGQTIEVCLDVDLPPARGIRSIVGVFVGESGRVLELTEVPARASECVLQDPSKTALRGRARQPGVYRLRQLKAKDLRGVTHVDPPEIRLEVKDTSGALEWNPSATT